MGLFTRPKADRQPGRKGPGTHERRVAHRYEPVEDVIQLGWWKGEDFQQVPALILNISLTGLMVLADRSTELVGSAWICLQNGSSVEWVEAEVVEIQKARTGPLKIRLRFQGPCPYHLFKAAIYGAEVLKCHPYNVSTEFDGKDWR